jgi:hypothetical protein
MAGYEEEAVDHREANGGNREEIHRGYGFLIVAKKGEPTLGRQPDRVVGRETPLR